MNNKVLITGASGFVANHLAKRLFYEDYSVHVLVKKTSDISQLKHNMGGWDWALHYHEVDLCEEKKLAKIVKQINPGIVYHFAANKASPSASSAENDIQTNIVGTWNLLKALSTCDYQLFVNAGSSSEYGVKSDPMKETDLLDPNSYHSFSKGAQTNLVHCYGQVEKRPVVTLRLFSVYGPYERETRLVPSVITHCLNKQKLKLSSPTVVRDFIFVDDVVDVCLKIDELKKNSGQIFNLGTGKQSTIKEVVDIISKLTGFEPKCLWNEDGRSWDIKNWVADCSKTEKLLGWKHSVDLESGLKKTIDWRVKYGI